VDLGLFIGTLAVNQIMFIRAILFPIKLTVHKYKVLMILTWSYLNFNLLISKLCYKVLALRGLGVFPSTDVHFLKAKSIKSES